MSNSILIFYKVTKIRGRSQQVFTSLWVTPLLESEIGTRRERAMEKRTPVIIMATSKSFGGWPYSLKKLVAAAAAD